MADEVVVPEVPVENKALAIAFEGDYMIVKVDPNKDGMPLLDLRLHYTQLPAEAAALFGKKA